ncbi:GNAT family N-acetyltransferase [Nocardia sp. BMG51109]|uniref:GNAT family N-acetyltransferase n=1 Tax=Nocardia sp. BMG51109 TaxID=1056816 RepID=UPI000466524C|nr:GNAT family N-acetyltransferase [Nocardia sp. BMG51109]
MNDTHTTVFAWRPVAPADFPLLATWLAQPHVRRWWNHEFTPEAVERDFGPAARGAEPGEDLLVYADGEPFGLVQRCRLADYPEYLDELSPLVEVPAGAASLDYLVGDPDRVGRGLGSAMLRAVVAGTWVEYPGTGCLLVPVAAANVASWRALEKAGMRRIAEGHLTPDNPADDGNHYVYRIGRPGAGT